MDPDIVGQVLRDYRAARAPEADPELEALRLAILVEDVFGITLSDAEIDAALLADPAAVAALAALAGRRQARSQEGQELCAASAESSATASRRTCPCWRA